MTSTDLLTPATINGQAYPVAVSKEGTLWQVVSGQELPPEVWDDWHLGMGDSVKTTGHGYFFSDGMDGSQYGVLRLMPARTQLGGLASTGGAYGYFFEAMGTASPFTKYMYLAVADKIYKMAFDGSALLSTRTVAGGATTIAGKPMYWKGKWYIGFGTTALVQRLDVVGIDPAADQWNNAPAPAWSAWGLCLFQNGVTPVAARSLGAAVDLTTDPSVGSPSFASPTTVGDTSTGISDLNEGQGRLYVTKYDNLYSFDQDSNAYPLIPFLSRSAPDAFNGTGTHIFGDAILAPYAQSAWRYRIGGGAIPFGPDTIRAHLKIPGITVAYVVDGRHRGFTSAGEWIYSTYDGGAGTGSLLVGRFRREGDLGGHEMIWHTMFASTAKSGLHIDSANKLWLSPQSGSAVEILQLNQDGSPAVDNRGFISTQHYMEFDERDWDLPYEQKQLRNIVVETENWAAATTAPLQMRMHRDGAAALNTIGAVIDGTGVFERQPTLGSDTFYRLRLRPGVLTTAGYTPTGSDPRILRITAFARSADIIRVVIPADEGSLMQYGLTPEDAEDNLRRLQDAQIVVVGEPGSTTTFNARIKRVTDTRYETSDGKINYGLEVTMTRFVTD